MFAYFIYCDYKPFGQYKGIQEEDLRSKVAIRGTLNITGFNEV